MPSTSKLLKPLRGPVRAVIDTPALFEATNFRPSSYNNEEAGYCTRFDVNVRVAGENRFTCQVIYDLGDITYPPDIIVDGGDGFTVALGEVEPLVHWDAEDEENLWKVLLRLRERYLEFQRRRIKGLDVQRIHFEFSSVEHRDVFVQEGNGRAQAKAIFQFPVRIEAKDDDGSEDVDMLIDISTEDGGRVQVDAPSLEARVTVTFVLSAKDVLRIEKSIDLPLLLEKANTFKIPDFPLEKSMVEFVIEVESRLREAYTRVRQRLRARRDLVIALVTEFSNNVVEYDDEEYLYASFLFEVSGTPAILNSRSSTAPV
ncbi:hypothetical protein HK104_004742 [Borealophlyctis nickersoniae]|nr:hypothetical protein HK104_004742 [Borealophlyctis nickersoniae]